MPEFLSDYYGVEQTEARLDSHKIPQQAVAAPLEVGWRHVVMTV